MLRMRGQTPWDLVLWVGLLFTPRKQMDRLFDKRKNTPKLSRHHIFLGVPANIAAGPLGFRAELDPKGKQNYSHHDFETDGPNLAVAPDERNRWTSRIVFHDKESQDQALPAPGTSTRGIAACDAERGNDPTSACFRPPLFAQISMHPHA